MTALRTAQPFLMFFFFFFFCSSIGIKLTSNRPPSGEQMYRPVTYAYRIPPACRVMPTFSLLRVSVPFYQVVRICRQTAAKLRMQGYHTHFYVSKLGYIRACVYMQPLKCGNSDIFACHNENRAYGFLAGV